nr:nuclear transport factor 2 family protein [uncultured Draconibacterium sp.]
MTKGYFKCVFLFLAILLTLNSYQSFGQDYTGESKIILETEKQALNEWGNRNVWGYLNLFASDATYFDTSTKMKLTGSEAIKSYTAPWNGSIYVPRHEMINVDIKVAGNVGVLSYNLYNFNESNDTTALWNSSEIYEKIDGNWKIIHSHWSLVALKK